MSVVTTEKSIQPLASNPGQNGEIVAPDPVGGKAFAVRSTDETINAGYLDRTKFEQIYSIAKMFADSQMVPEHFRNKVPDCFIACQLAFRMGMDPFMLMQNCYIVHGRPGFEAKLVIALINSSGLFEDPLHFEFNNADPCSPEWGVTVSARRRRNGTTCRIEFKYGTAIAEGWVSKSGSKWKSMSDQMMRYRGATFFARVYCPEVLLGIDTVDEIEDVGTVKVLDNELKPGRQSFGFNPDRALGAPNADNGVATTTEAKPDEKAAPKSVSTPKATDENPVDRIRATKEDGSGVELEPKTGFEACVWAVQERANVKDVPKAEKVCTEFLKSRKIDIQALANAMPDSEVTLAALEHINRQTNFKAYGG